MPEDVMELEDAALGEDTYSDEGGDESEEVDSEGQEEGAELQNEGDESEGEDEEQPEGEQQEEQKPVENAQDGRKMPDAVKKAFANLKSSNPEAAKTLRATWFQNQDYKAVFPTPADAVALKDKFEMLGGEEGIAAIESERQEWQGIEKQVEEGKIADILAEQPEILAKNAVGMVNKWAEKAPDQYQYYANKLTYNKMGGDGTLRTLSAIHGLLADNPQAQQAIAEMHDHLYDMREKSAQFEQKRVDPREEQLSQERQRFEDERRADFESKVEADAYVHRDTSVKAAIEGLLNGRKVSPEWMETYTEKVIKEIERQMDQIPGFTDRLEALYRTGDRAKAVSYIKQQYNRILGPGKAANVIEPLLRNINPQKTAKPGEKEGSSQKPQQRSAEPGSVVLKEWPDHDKVDWNRTSSADYAQGKAILTNGKRASGWV